MIFCFFESDLYHHRVRARYEITKDIIRKHGIEVVSFTPRSKTLSTQAFELVSFASYTALYLGILNGEDPGPNPWVDHLKYELSKVK